MSKFIIIGVLVLLIIIAYVIYNKNKTTKIEQEIIANTPPPCVPFTKQQQDAEKRQKEANCYGKNLIPFIGQARFIACISNVKSTLTPIKNCDGGRFVNNYKLTCMPNCTLSTDTKGASSTTTMNGIKYTCRCTDGATSSPILVNA